MKTIKLIDYLILIAKGEEVPVVREEDWCDITKFDDEELLELKELLNTQFIIVEGVYNNEIIDYINEDTE